MDNNIADKITDKMLDTIIESSLFQDIEKSDAARLVRCLDCKTAVYQKGEMIFMQGQTVNAAGIVLCGKAHAENVSYSGKKSIIQSLSASDTFGDALMSSKENNSSPVSIVAEVDTTVLFVPFDGIMNGCEKNCYAHRILRQNVLSVLSDKFWTLNKKISYLSEKSLRLRIAMFLLDNSAHSGTDTFNIVFSREGMADYLCANRSALSRELSRMKDDKLITYYKNTFKILDHKALLALT